MWWKARERFEVHCSLSIIEEEIRLGPSDPRGSRIRCEDGVQSKEQNDHFRPTTNSIITTLFTLKVAVISKAAPTTALPPPK
jgi:hypothetical protein